MLILFRVGKQRLREAITQAVDYVILLIAGACLGTLTKVDDETFGSTGYTFIVIAICKFKNANLGGHAILVLNMPFCFMTAR